jgi:hypothetical protein
LTFSCLTGGLASPPDSRNNSPLVPIASSSGSNLEKLPSLRFVNPKDLHDPPECEEKETESMPRSRKSSLLSSLSGSSDLSDDEDIGTPMISVDTQRPLADSSEVGEDDEDGGNPRMTNAETGNPLTDSSEVGEEDEDEVNLLATNDETEKPLAESSEVGEEDGDEGNLVGPTAETEMPLTDSPEIVEDDEDDDNHRINVETEMVADPSEVAEDIPDLYVKVIKKTVSDSLEDEVDRMDEVDEMILEFGVENVDRRIVVESGKPVSETTDSSEDDEGEPMTGMKNLSDSAGIERRDDMDCDGLEEDDKEDHPMTGFNEMKLSDPPEDEIDSVDGANKTLVDCANSSVDLAGQFKPRRSYRNALKNKPSLKVAAAPRLSNSKRKPAFKDTILLEVNALDNPIPQKLTECYLE